jgi:hypothetical protein
MGRALGVDVEKTRHSKILELLWENSLMSHQLGDWDEWRRVTWTEHALASIYSLGEIFADRMARAIAALRASCRESVQPV